MLERIPDVRPVPQHEKLKPRQVRDFHKVCTAVLHHLLTTGKDFAAIDVSRKYDGRSVILQCYEDGKYEVSARTDTETVHWSGFEAQRFVTQLACDLQTRFTCELRGLYEGVELGYLEVMAMLKIFLEGHLQNTAPFQLQICPFGVYSVNKEGFPSTERACSFLPRMLLADIMAASVNPDQANTLVQAVPKRMYKAVLYDCSNKQHQLEFQNGAGQTVARSPQEFFDLLIAEADALGAEGWVMTVPREIFAKTVVADCYGVPRDQASVKVKREFDLILMACRVWDDKGKKMRIFTYGAGEDRTLVYTGEATDHALLNQLLPKQGHAFSFKNKAEKTGLYTLRPDAVRAQSALVRMVSTACTNLSKTRYCVIGLKIAGTKQLPLDLSRLSNTRVVAEANPHFRSTKAASDKFAAAIGRKKERKPDRKRQRECAPQSLDYTDFAVEAMEPDDAPAPSRELSPAPSRELSPMPAADPTELENKGFEAHMAWCRTPKRRVAVDGIKIRGGVSVISYEDSEGRTRVLTSDSPEWTDPVQCGWWADGEWVDVLVAPPPKSETRPSPPYRKPLIPAKVYIDAREAGIGPMALKILVCKIRFFGGRIAHTLGLDVDIVVTGRMPGGLRIMTDEGARIQRDFMVKHHAHLKALCHPGVVLTTPEGVQAVLRR
jgi:hypothetical protein